MSRDETQLRFAICWRPIPARVGEEHIITRLLRDRRYHAIQTQDTSLAFHEFDVVLILENCHWFPTIMNELAAMKKNTGRPQLVVWHWEPLPLPKAAGIPSPSLSARELAKIMLRDVRATDVYTNLADLRRLSRQGWPDLLIVSSQAWQESLAEHGIAAHWMPYGCEIGDGAPIGGPRDIEALFLGALDVPRRKRIIKELRRRGVDLVAKGSWSDQAFWGEDRTRLINRAEAFINIQRYPGEISAHRLILGMANKSLVVSEPIYRPAPFFPGEHYVEAEVSEMPETLTYYRTHHAERDSIVDRAYRFVAEELTMETSVSRVLSLVDGLRDHRWGKA
jgi:hypothetical protein